MPLKYSFSGLTFYTLSKTQIVCRALQLRFFSKVETLLNNAFNVYLFWYSPDGGESFPENDKDPLGPAAECRSGAVKGRVSRPKHYHIAMEARQVGLASAHSCPEKNYSSIDCLETERCNSVPIKNQKDVNSVPIELSRLQIT